MIKLKLEKGVNLPKYETDFAAGFDVVANSILKVFSGDREMSEEKLINMQQKFKQNGFIKIRPFERILFGTGLTLAGIPESTELQVRGRSGVSLKRGLLTILGTIDEDYRQEIGIIIYNSNNFLSEISRGERLAQLVCNPILQEKIVEVYSTETTNRNGGFGSTGTI